MKPGASFSETQKCQSKKYQTETAKMKIGKMFDKHDHLLHHKGKAFPTFQVSLKYNSKMKLQKCFLPFPA